MFGPKVWRPSVTRHSRILPFGPFDGSSTLFVSQGPESPQVRVVELVSRVYFSAPDNIVDGKNGTLPLTPTVRGETLSLFQT